MGERSVTEFQRLRLEDPILRAREVARLLRVSTSQAHNLIKDDRIAALRLAGTKLVRVRLSAVERYLAGCAAYDGAG